jgi:drug/metabolite transporter (DMT)-like permease
MIYLALSISCSTIIVLLFRSFTNFRIHSFQAIVFNYLTCLLIGLSNTSSGQLMKVPAWSGLEHAVFLGMLFIALFYLIARTTQTIGVTVASVAQKLSFVIPVIAGIAVFDEAFNLLKLTGFILAVLAVLFISVRTGEIKMKDHFWMPLLVFAGSGVCDLMIKIVEEWHIGPVTKATFTVVLFGTAFFFGFMWMAGRILFTAERPDLRSVFAGVLLGIPNYGSIYFLIAALQQSGLEASQVFPINNVGIILLSAAMAWMIFSEHLNRMQIAGLVLALAAIFVLI